ncbi:TNF receptor-associated factor 5-like [Clytia hemisphaerica]|uniref:MATH domain-containing protein n=1 Tax=Clytia hemisphaerica TaxID=252671 RepID=A0A7M5UWC4_9CNID
MDRRSLSFDHSCSEGEEEDCFQDEDPKARFERYLKSFQSSKMMEDGYNTFQIQKEVRNMKLDFEDQMRLKTDQIMKMGDILNKIRNENEETNSTLKKQLKMKDERLIKVEERLRLNEEVLVKMRRDAEIKEIRITEQLKTKDEKLAKLERKLKDTKENLNKFKAENEAVLHRLEKSVDEKNTRFSIQMEAKDEKIVKIEAKLEKNERRTKENEEDLLQLRDECGIKDQQLAVLDRGLTMSKKMAQSLLTTPQCPFTWEITDFVSKFDDAREFNNRIHSPSFFCLEGYKGMLKVYLNGNGNYTGTHITATFDLVPGPFDDMLTWPMSYDRFSFKFCINGADIASQTIKRSAGEGRWKDDYTRPEDEQKGSGGWGTTISHRKLPKIFEDDTITFIFEIE